MSANTFNNDSSRWIDFVVNKQSVHSLYQTPPSLERVHIQTIDMTMEPSQTIKIAFFIEQMPDIIPRHGLWSKHQQSAGVCMLWQFNSIENFVIDNSPQQCRCCISIILNPDFIDKAILVDNVWVFDRVDRIKVELSNIGCNLSFTAYSIRICSIKPVI